jgi:hypothetical protein
LDNHRKPTTPDFGVWVEDPQEGTFLVHGLESTMREIFGNVIEKMPAHIYLKAGYAFGFTPLSTPISVSV